MNKHVLVLTKYSRNAASSRLRTLQYLPYLEGENYKFTVRPLFDDHYLSTLYQSGRRFKIYVFFLYLKRFCHLISFWRYSFIWVEKELFPYLPPWVEVLLKCLSVKYIVDYDDAIFHNYDMAQNKWVRRLLSSKIDTVMRHSYSVVAGNEYLANRAFEARAKRVFLVPTVVDIRRYSIDFRSQKDFLTVGWIGSPTTQAYLETLFPVFRALSSRMQFRLLLVGANSDIVDRLPGLKVDLMPWSEDTEVLNIKAMDVGIMPLTDGPWEKGKCGYKLIQYMACGVPVVASPVGVNTSIVKDSGSGLLASSLEDWETCLASLLSSPELRYRYGSAGRASVESSYSIDVCVNLVRQAFPL